MTIFANRDNIPIVMEFVHASTMNKQFERDISEMEQAHKCRDVPILTLMEALCK